MKVRSAYSNLTKTSLIDFRQGKALKMKVHIWSYTANNKALVFYAVIFTEEINFGEKITWRKTRNYQYLVAYSIYDQWSKFYFSLNARHEIQIFYIRYLHSYHYHLLTTWLLCTMYILTLLYIVATTLCCAVTIIKQLSTFPFLSCCFQFPPPCRR